MTLARTLDRSVNEAVSSLLGSTSVGTRGIVFAVLLVVGCGHAPSTASSPAARSSTAPSIPEDLRPAVERATRIGRAIFEQDQVSARATDLWLAKVPPDRRARGRGWVTVDGPWWKVVFIEGTPGAERVAFEAAFPRDQPPDQSHPTFQAIDPPRPLEQDEELRWRAFRTAVRSVSGGCGKPMNPVVLSASLEGNDGWLVYLLNSTNKSGETILGGHLRIRISPDGDSVVETQRLSQCLVQPPPPPGATSAGLVMVTPLFDTPNEGHVFTAMNYREPLLLGTWKTVRGRMWLVAPDGSIDRDRDIAPP